MRNYLENSKTTLIEGAIESGKTTGVIFSEFKRAIDNNENILVLDAKEEYYTQYQKELEQKDYNVIVLNLNDVNKSNNYNPYTLPYYYYKNGNKDTAIDLIERVAANVFLEENNGGDPFWIQTSSDLFIGLSLILMKEAENEKQVNIGDLSILLDMAHRKYKDSNLIKMYLDKLDPLDPIYTSASETIYAPMDTKGSIISVSKPKIKSYILRPDLLSLLSSTNFDLINIGIKKTAIFVIPNENMNDFNNVANIFIDQIIYLIKYNNLKFNLILDNIDFINRVESLYTLLNMPSENINLIIATRNLEALKQKYIKGTFDNVITNVKVKDNKIIINNETYALKLIEKINDKVEYPKTFKDTEFFNIEKHLINLLDK